MQQKCVHLVYVSFYGIVRSNNVTPVVYALNDDNWL